MKDDDDILSEDLGSDTDIRRQGDRDTQTGDGRSKRPPLPFTPGEICGDFQLEKLLGQGSSGSVFRALDTVSRRTCALKILTATKQHDLRRNRIGFRRMMGLRHPNLMRVDQMHQVGEYLALSMEEIQGETLSRARRRLRKLDSRIAYNKLLSLARDYAAGLAAIHGHGLLHRDIKPSNLMVDRNDRGRIIDYGLVGTFDAELASKCYRDYIAGTPRYISPEAYFEQRYTPAGDIFSLGLALVETLKSIGGLAEWSRSKDTRDEDAVLISSAVEALSDDVPEILREACMEMLQINPGDRPTAMQIARLGMPIGMTTIYMGGQPLFGREEEFKDVCSWLAEVYNGKQGRLHIHGGSGIGKTALVDAIERHLRSLNWGQVFRAECRPRENKPLQAFDQIVDAIANRYASSDREPMELDPVSTMILHNAFPVLQDAVQASMRIPKVESKNERTDALQAAINLTVEMRRMGPLILIIDDVHWSDSDTNMVLDALQTCGGGMLGIITISRFEKSSQQQRPQKVLGLKPLSDEVAYQILADAAQRWSVNATRAALKELAETTCGNPFRLSELCDEFRPNGLLHVMPDTADSSLSNLGDLDRLWQHRVNRLSDAARQMLPLIVTAGFPVSIDQLAQLSGPGTSVEIAVSELVRRRLVTDDATGGCCIQMIHDRISDGVTDQLDQADKVSADLAWAELLLAEPDEDKYAGRIARHLTDAGKPNEAVPHACRAAEQALRTYAFDEAGEWHLIVADTIDSPQQSRHHLLEATRCFQIAGQPVKAAQLHVRLSDTPDNDEQLQHRIAATLLLVRSGRVEEVREELGQLAETLGLSTTCSDGAAAFAAPTIHQLHDQSHLPKTHIDAATPTELARFSFATSLVRPIVLHDAAFAKSLFASAHRMGKTIGSPVHHVGLAIGNAVYLCCDDGERRIAGEALLRDLHASATDLGDKTEGDWWTAKVLSDVLKMNWAALPESLACGIKAYESSAIDRPVRLEQANIRWLGTFADWYKGNWAELAQTTEQLTSDARLHNDLLCEFTATTGLAAAAQLGQEVQTPITGETLVDLDTITTPPEEFTSSSMQVADWLVFIAACQKATYDGAYSKAMKLAQSFSDKLAESDLTEIQLARVLTKQLVALTSLHVNAIQSKPESAEIAAAAITDLQSEQLACAIMLAELYGGILAGQLGDTQASRRHLTAAQQLAKEQHLAPFRLAAEDALSTIKDGEQSGLLQHRMQNRGIESPHQFERLYTARIQ